MAVYVLVVNALSGKPDGGVEKLFGKPNDLEGEGALISSALLHMPWRDFFYLRTAARVTEGTRAVHFGSGARTLVTPHAQDTLVVCPEPRRNADVLPLFLTVKLKSSIATDIHPYVRSAAVANASSAGDAATVVLYKNYTR